MVNLFSKTTLAITLATLFSVNNVNATDSFAELDAEVAQLNKSQTEKKADFHAYVNRYLDEYEAWRDAYTKELDKRKRELISTWGEGEVSSNTTSVEYSEDGTVRTTIDYEKGTMEVSVLTGEKEILEFDINLDEHYWPNSNEKNYIIDIELPEFMCKCPRSGYPDFATIKLQYTPDQKVIELKALKLYINSFMNRHVSHENSANEIFDTLYSKLQPRWMKVVADFKPRGNVHTVIEIDSAKM